MSARQNRVSTIRPSRPKYHLWSTVLVRMHGIDERFRFIAVLSEAKVGNVWDKVSGVFVNWPKIVVAAVDGVIANSFACHGVGFLALDEIFNGGWIFDCHHDIVKLQVCWLC